MQRPLQLFSLLAFLFIAQDSFGVLTLQLDGNGLLEVIVTDGGAGDLDGDAGEILVDATTLAGWAGGATFMVTADTIQSKMPSGSAGGGGGQLNVGISFDYSGGDPFGTSISVSSSELFTVKGAPIAEFSGNVSVAGDAVVTANNHFFSTSLPDPAPLDPFDFLEYPESESLSPPSIGGGSTSTFFNTPGGNLGTRLRMANTVTIALDAGDVGTITMSTIVNPEPSSILLSMLGAGVFWAGYRRRQNLMQVDG